MIDAQGREEPLTDLLLGGVLVVAVLIWRELAEIRRERLETHRHVFTILSHVGELETRLADIADSLRDSRSGSAP